MAELEAIGRLRSDSSSDSASTTSELSLSGHPLGLRRQDSTGGQADIDDLNSLDCSYLDSDVLQMDTKLTLTIVDHSLVTSINLSGNRLKTLPPSLSKCVNLQVLDLSQNSMTQLDPAICRLSALTTLILSNNQLEAGSFPKEFGGAMSSSLKVLSLGGNRLRTLPRELFELSQLRSLYLGGNEIEEISKDIKRLANLRVLYLGGNSITSIPDEVGHLSNLQSLSLCENRIRSLPSTISNLKGLRSLALHKNQLTALPPEIVRLRGLVELSLRNNPLVVRFVKDFSFNTPSLLEMAGRAVKVHKLPFDHESLPKVLVEYLESGRRCVNPKCKGVYFDAHVEQIKFVDFCGIYRLPLLQYLCSPNCSTSGIGGNNRAGSSSMLSGSSGSDNDSELDNDVPLNKLRRVLLG